MSRIWRHTHMWTSSNSWSLGDHSSTCLGFLDRPCNHQRNLHSCNHQCSHQLHHPCHHRHQHCNFNGYQDHGHSHRYMHLPDSWSVPVVPPVLTSSSPKSTPYNSEHATAKTQKSQIHRHIQRQQEQHRTGLDLLITQTHNGNIV